MFNILVLPVVVANVLIMLNVNPIISLATIPVAYFLAAYPELYMRNSYRLTVLDPKLAEKQIEDEEEAELELAIPTDKPFEISDPHLPVVSSKRGDDEKNEKPLGNLLLNPDDYKEVEEEWRIHETFKGTSLEGRLPLRAIQLLKQDGWNSSTIESTWPTGATNKLIKVNSAFHS